MINLATDVIKDWSFNDGDLITVTGIGNLSQAIENRLNTYIGEMNDFYIEYGSQLFDYLGEMNQGNIHQYVKIEIEHSLIQDKRINSVECNITKIGSNEIEGILSLTLVDETDVDLNMIITNDNKVSIQGVG